LIALIEARPLDGGLELVFDLGRRRASVLVVRGRAPEFPHHRSDLGESVGTNANEEIRRTAKRVVAYLDAGELWRAAGGRRW
jgi:hypothetical protein